MKSLFEHPGHDRPLRALGLLLLGVFALALQDSLIKLMSGGDFLLAISNAALDRQSQFYRNTRAGERQPRPDNSKRIGARFICAPHC